MPAIEPAPGEVRIRVQVSGVNPGDVKKRQNTFALGLPFPRIVPHSDGAGVVDKVGSGTSTDWLGARVWCFGAQSYRAFGTAAEYCSLSVENIVLLPDNVTFEQGALLGIPGITAHRAVQAGAPLSGKAVLVQGAAGAVGSIAVLLAKRAGARVVAVVRKPQDVAVAREAGADHVLLPGSDLVDQVLSIAPGGIDHVVEVAFGANIELDEKVLGQAGSIAVYASDTATPSIPLWPLVFKNISLHFLGSDDFPIHSKREAAHVLTAAAEQRWVGLPVGATYALNETADAHARVERGGAGRVIVKIQ